MAIGEDVACVPKRSIWARNYAPWWRKWGPELSALTSGGASAVCFLEDTATVVCEKWCDGRCQYVYLQKSKQWGWWRNCGKCVKARVPCYHRVQTCHAVVKVWCTYSSIQKKIQTHTWTQHDFHVTRSISNLESVKHRKHRLNDRCIFISRLNIAHSSVKYQRIWKGFLRDPHGANFMITIECDRIYNKFNSSQTFL